MTAQQRFDDETIRVGEGVGESVRLVVEVHGAYDGSRVLLISGTGGDLRVDPRRHLHPLVQRGFRVAMYDQRGLGRSEKPDVAYSMADYADDAAGVLDALGWPSAHVIGISFGGMVAQHVVLRHQTRVDRLVLACTSSGGEGGSSADLLALADLNEPERSHRQAALLDSRNDFSVDPPVYAPGLEFLAFRAEQMAALATDADAAMGARRQLEARDGHNVWAELPSVDTPTLVIGGRFDHQAPPENLERLAGRIPGAQLVFCDGGHLFMLQDPSAWPTIAAFLHS